MGGARGTETWVWVWQVQPRDKNRQVWVKMRSVYSALTMFQALSVHFLIHPSAVL